MKKYYFIFDEGSKVNQLICAILVNFPSFAYGASVGWISPMTLLLQSDKSPRATPLSVVEISWIASIGYIICTPMDLILAYLGQVIGRKKSILILSVSCATCWILKLCSMEVWVFLLARTCIGIIMAGSYVICPMYTKEISEDSIRGLLGSFVTLFQTSGNLLLYILGDILDYNTVLWVCLALPTIHMVLFMFMPDSPSYLVKCGKIQEATKALAWLRCKDENDASVKHEIELIKKELEKDNENDQNVMKAIVTDKILFRALRIVTIITLAREVCGAIPVLNFAGDIFTTASEGSALFLTPNQQAMMLGAVQVAGSILATSIVEKAGRKPLIIIASLISGISMVALATWFVCKDSGLQPPSWLPVVTLCVCIFCDSAGLQPMSVVIISEIFSYKYRGTVLGFTMALASIAAFLQALFFQPLATAIGIHVAFYFFGAVCIGATLYVILVMPETKVRSIEEIQNDLKTKKEKALELREMEDIQRSENKCV